jgi:hypothetical protein
MVPWFKKQFISVHFFTSLIQKYFLHPNLYLYLHYLYTAKMGKKWVQESFKHILLANCKAYLESNNLGKIKARTQLINDVADKVREAAARLNLPEDLNKVC